MRMMVGRIVGTGLRAQLPALQTVCRSSLSTPRLENVLFGCWLDLDLIGCSIRFAEGSVALFSPDRRNT